MPISSLDNTSAIGLHRPQWLDSCIVSSEITFLSKQDVCMKN